MRRLVMATSFLAALAIGAATAPGPGEFTEDSLETVRTNVDEETAVLVDVREKAEWDEGHIEGSVFLPLSSLKEGLKKEKLAKALPEERVLYTFCVVGKRALMAEVILEELDYEVRALEPGYEQLIRAGFKKADQQH